MLAYSRLGWPLRTSLTRRDGYEPEEVYPALSLASRFRQPALSTVTLPSLLAKTKKGRAGKGTPQSVRDPDLAKQILLRTMRTLLNHMRKVTPAHRFSNWSHYAETANHYSDEDHADKRKFVSDALGSARPAKALDVGCNTGVYSNLAADAGAEVVSIDTDLPAVDRLYAGLKENGKNILPLCVDLAHPSPATGWENRESASFLSRCAGHFDAVIMLAVLHHLLLHNQIPMDRIAALCGEPDNATPDCGMGASDGSEVPGASARTRCTLPTRYRDGISRGFWEAFHGLRRADAGERAHLVSSSEEIGHIAERSGIPMAMSRQVPTSI
ncbi:class I SAM-dependent methyltransferase [Tunturiibacter empetritectus]|uniref:class I SAM-dependent methyltransferase n=1 Tax=Tunturiibacter empetritectus TaxID=3069691 RepID=UPI003D9B51D6